LEFSSTEIITGAARRSFGYPVEIWWYCTCRSGGVLREFCKGKGTGTLAFSKRRKKSPLITVFIYVF
jgi:hypothetical protein